MYIRRLNRNRIQEVKMHFLNYIAIILVSFIDAKMILSTFKVTFFLSQFPLECFWSRRQLNFVLVF